MKKKKKDPHVTIDNSSASTLDILEVLISPEGKKELEDMAELAKQLKLPGSDQPIK